ncbi:MAG: hypothetical protein EBQ88_00675 [Betaproteobacteria bacterium]|nr:hypothetical protein [Betaproteobacteria bacterium]
MGVLPGCVDAEAFAEEEKVLPAGATGHLRQAWCASGACRSPDEVFEEVGFHIEGRVHAKRVHAHFTDPVRVAAPQGLAYPGVGGIEVIQPRHLPAKFLFPVGVVADIGRPVVDAGAAVFCPGGVVQVEGALRGRGHRAAALVGLPPALGIHVEEVAHMVDHDVLHQVHAAAVQRV